jgi:hypothetical protein
MQECPWSIAVAYALGMLTALVVFSSKDPHDR